MDIFASKKITCFSLVSMAIFLIDIFSMASGKSSDFAKVALNYKNQFFYCRITYRWYS